MKNLRKGCILLVILLVITSLSYTAFANEIDNILELQKLEEDMDFLKEVAVFVKDEYLYEETYENLVENMYRGMMGNLDRYSTYYSKQEYEMFLEDASGESTGVGIWLKEENNQVQVLEVLLDSPAYKAGMAVEDIIIGIDGKDVKKIGKNDIARLLNGQEGKWVKVKARRGKDILTFNMRREVVNTIPVEAYSIDDQIGYLRIAGFGDNTYDLVKEALKKLDKENVKKIVIDLRDNPGGEVQSAADILSLFVTEGPVVYTRYVNREPEIYESHLKKQNYKLAVLVNERTASASEIFTGAVKDKKEGVIIGTKTYGKGVIQTIYQLKNNAGIKITTGEYLTPNKNRVQGIGIMPDYVVMDTRDQCKIDLSKYPVLDKSRIATNGVVGLDVLAAEMILETLEYKVDTPDGIFDKTTTKELKAFQKDKGIMVSGILDFETQDCLTHQIEEYAIEHIDDAQLKMAIDKLKKL